MQYKLSIGNDKISLELPENTVVYRSGFPEKHNSTEELFFRALENLIESEKLGQIVSNRKPGNAVIVVSDITRPIPYKDFLPAFIERLIENGIKTDEIIILIATGMHRTSTEEERVIILGEEVVTKYKVIDHVAEDESSLVTLPGKTHSGKEIKLNKIYVEAGLKIVTGLVEPHFMAGFSGGRKAICPGLAALKTIQNFHGYKFLSNENARNGNLNGNPCHIEALSVAKTVGCDLNINIVLNDKKDITAFFIGELEKSHEQAVEYVSKYTCTKVPVEVDLVITSSGGFPLDTTFYQCVKGFVSATPAVKKGGKLIAFGSCTEGIGSKSYTGIMKRYAGDYAQFNKDISNSNKVEKDQWQFQMHCKTLNKVNVDDLIFLTPNLNKQELKMLNVNGIQMRINSIQKYIQVLINEAVNSQQKIAVFPDGPYAIPV
jgi:lactate racemase